MDPERYEITRSLGKDFLGGIYEAWDNDDKQKVAIRRFFTPSDQPIVEGYKNEFIRIAKSLENALHTNLIRIFDTGFDEDGPYITTEILDCPKLSDIHPEGALPAEEVLLIMEQLLKALQHSHQHHFIHGALNLKSIYCKEMVSSKKAYIIADLGLRQLSEFLHDQLQDKGTDPCFLSPEQLKGDPPSARSDLYSLGNIGYALLLGGHPFGGFDQKKAQEGHLKGLPPANYYNKNVPKALDDWIHQLTRPNPQDRPHSAKAALELLPSLQDLGLLATSVAVAGNISLAPTQLGQQSPIGSIQTAVHPAPGDASPSAILSTLPQDIPLPAEPKQEEQEVEVVYSRNWGCLTISLPKVLIFALLLFGISYGINHLKLLDFDDIFHLSSSKDKIDSVNDSDSKSTNSQNQANNDNTRGGSGSQSQGGNTLNKNAPAFQNEVEAYDYDQ